MSAMLHARQIPSVHLVIYPCEICMGIHVGHDRIRYAAHCEREGRSKAASLLRRIRMHEQVIEERRTIVVRLKRDLESVIAFYGCGSTNNDFGICECSLKGLER